MHKAYLKKTLKSLLAIALMFCTIATKAQFSTLEFEQITVDQGLSSNIVLKVIRSKDNYIWIATTIGLNRYDGTNVRKYINNKNDSNSLCSSYTTCLMEDSDEYLWIGTTTGLNLYNKHLDNFKQYMYDSDGKSLGYIQEILQDPEGVIWLLTHDKLYYIQPSAPYTDKININCALSLNTQTRFNDFYDDKNGNIWIVGRKEILYKFNIELSKLSTYTIKTARTKNLIKCITGHPDGKLWIGSNGNGLTMFDAASETFFDYSANLSGTGPSGEHIRDLCIHKNRYLYISVEQSGINRLDLKTGEFEYCLYDEDNISGLSKDAIFSVYIDKENILYASIYEGGVNIHNPKKHKFKTVKHIPYKTNTLTYNVIRGFYEDTKGNIWIGTDGGGVSKYNPQSGKFSNYKYDPIYTSKSKLFKNDVLSITEDKYNNILVSTWNGGINVYNPQKDMFVPMLSNESDATSIPNNRIYIMYTDGNKNTWISPFRKGLFLFDVKKGVTPIHFPDKDKHLLSDSISLILGIGSDKIGVISSIGYSEIDINTHKPSGFKRFDQYFDFSNRINDVLLDSEGNRWFATNRLGLIKYNADTIVNYCTTKDFPANSAYCIIEDADKNIWVSTSQGISCYSYAEKIFKNYNQHDGLQGKQFLRYAKLKAKDGTIYFGGYNGFNYFKPEEIVTNNYIPDVAINNIIVSNDIYSASTLNVTEYLKKEEKLILEYEQRDISFSFNAIHHTNPQKCQYAYKLAGYDSLWIETNSMHRIVTYTNLNPNDYTFLVKCTNNDGVWNLRPATFQFLIKTPFWQTRWFIFIIILLLVSISILFHKIRIRRITNQKKVLETTVENRTAELYQANTRLEEQHEELHTAYAELDNYKQNLEKLVASRTEELSKAKEKAEESDNLKTSFLANLSHEIRTPLNAIVGFSDLIVNGEIADNQKEKIARIVESSSDTLVNMIEDILDISRIEAGQLNINMQPIDICEALSELIDSYQIQIENEYKENNKTLHLLYSPESYLLNKKYVTDIHRLKQVISNLINNAIKFTPSGVIELKCNVDQQQQKIWFYVKDSGIGIKREDQHKIFERFRKIETEVATLYRGTGLGLSISKNLVELMGGKIQVKSVPDLGSTFSFYIPLKTEEEEEEIG